MKVEVILEQNGNKISDTDLIAKAKEDFTNAGNKASNAKKLAVYVKPEESKAYYVINEDFSGSIDF